MTYEVKWSALFAQLPTARRDHPLRGEFEGCRECHIQGDWLLVYRKCRQTLIMTCVTTGTHSDIFDE